MKRKSTLTKIVVAMAATLLSLPAAAQLSLSAGAKAEADADKGADASATADGDAEAADAGAAEGEGDATTEEEVAPPPPPPPAPEPEPVAEPVDEGDTGGTAGYDKGFYIKSNDGNFKLVIHGMAKTRWNLLNDSYAVDDNGDIGTNHTMRSNFSMNYARLYLTGHMFTPKLGFALYYNFPTATTVYAFASYKFIPDKLMIKVGLFKRPISRAYLASSVKRQFIDGPLGDMGGGIDLGIELSNDYTSVKGLEWAVGVFNHGGSGVGAPVGTNPAGAVTDNNGYQTGIGGDFAPALVGRIGYNNGIKGYSEVDFEGGPLRFGVAFSASTEFDHDDNNVSQHYLSIDGMLKVNGLALSAAGYMQAISEDGFWDPQANSQANNGLNDIGAFLQGGYLIKGRFEPMLRIGMRHDYNVDEDLRLAFTQGFGIYFFKNHSLKWENNLTQHIKVQPPGSLATGTAVNGDAEVFADLLFSSQLQFFF
ncbi:MAG: hypothetical protein JXX29_04585 [Deltaproteobacteria bacterium]|nr:hypothetical protein [Deltaproteobacteria bacterium]MBN2670922.1 hypothetical protein [Deltaproteobacteria bacterium]